MTLPADRAGMNLGAGAQGEADLAEPSTQVNRLRRHALVFKARPAVSVDALSPFGRGANAPLAGRTILQIVPPLAAGGDERATLAVTAALAETGARALVATDSGELAGELQAIGGLFVRFPAATKNPLAMALNMRRLQRIIASERVDLVHARSRWAAWAAVKACRKAKRPLVTSLPGDGGRTRPRTSFETAVAEGDYCHRLVGIRRRARGKPLSHASQAPQGRPTGNGSLQASAGTGERAARVRRSLELGRRRA